MIRWPTFESDLQESLATSGKSTQEPEDDRAEDDDDDDGEDTDFEEGYVTPPRKTQPAQLTPDNMETQAFDMDTLLFGGLILHDSVFARRISPPTHFACADTASAQRRLDSYVDALQDMCSANLCKL